MNVVSMPFHNIFKDAGFKPDDNRVSL